MLEHPEARDILRPSTDTAGGGEGMKNLGTWQSGALGCQADCQFYLFFQNFASPGPSIRTCIGPDSATIRHSSC